MPGNFLMEPSRAYCRLGSMRYFNPYYTSKIIMRKIKSILLLIFFLMLPAAACSVPSLPTIPNIPFLSDPVQPTPDFGSEPIEDTLTLLAPAFATSLQPGETVPGTGLTYIGRSGDAYEVSIDGLNAFKRSGDSFFWSGVIAPSVFANYKLRLTTSLFGGLPVAGPVELLVLFPEPAELPEIGQVDAKYHFSNLFVDYKVPAGSQVPGTTLFYEGVEGLGADDQLARFGGLSGYPYLAVGDSLVWNGRLRDNVFIRYNLRTISFDEGQIHLVGTGDLWIIN